ncbi:hypothetical protein GGF43_003495 [Coemansia sp. RSA 2618]|nr:hypothetical protein GGF43_003495 [Coemansia sp. RSA 2618]
MEPGAGSGDVYDQSMHLLLEQVNERREQAARLFQLLEQSINHTPAAPRHYASGPHSGAQGPHVDARGLYPDTDKDGPPFDGLILEDSVADSQSYGSASPPASFLEGFTRDFVDAYEAPDDSIVESPATTASGGRFGRLVLRAQSQADYPRSSPYARGERGSSPEVGQQSVSDRSDFEDDESADGVDEADDVDETDEADETDETDEAVPRGAAVIDRAARARLWQRVDAVAARPCDQDERRIAAIVALTERIAAMQTAPAEVVQEAPGETTQTTATAATQITPTETAQPIPAAPESTLERWTVGEWEQWADFARSTDMHPPSSASMAERLEWVHARQPSAWQYGFSDLVLANGKLTRTYRDVSLDLQAYADGNVKRTAVVEGDLCVTLFFANGDWSCEAKGRSYYYYSDERVWHEQAEGRSVYRYADGREEARGADGTVTVRYPSGDVRVSVRRD